MSSDFLITRPNHDPGTSYLFFWSALVIDVAKKKGVKVLDLAASKSNKKDFVSYIQRNDPKLVFFNGHGSQRSITGDQNEPLIEQGENEHLLKGRIVYARSCDAGSSLGVVAVSKGTLVFIGYSRSFILGYSPESISHPLRDEIAKLFLLPSNLIPISLLKGNSAGEADQKSKGEMTKNLSYMLSGAASQAQKEAAPYMWNNIQCQLVIGDSKSRL